MEFFIRSLSTSKPWSTQLLKKIYLQNVFYSFILYCLLISTHTLTFTSQSSFFFLLPSSISNSAYLTLLIYRPLFSFYPLTSKNKPIIYFFPHIKKHVCLLHNLEMYAFDKREYATGWVLSSQLYEFSFFNSLASTTSTPKERLMICRFSQRGPSYAPTNQTSSSSNGGYFNCSTQQKNESYLSGELRPFLLTLS